MTNLSTSSTNELRKLLSGQAPADFADWLDFVAIGALLAFVWQVEAFVFALLAVCMGLPYLLVGPFAGALVDRYDTKHVLILSNLGRGLVTALFFFAPNWQILLMLIALRSSVDTFFTPAKQSAIQTLTSHGQRTRVNSISFGINQASKIVAPAIGGSLLAITSANVVFLMNSVVSLIAASVFMSLKDMPPISVEEPENGAGKLSAIRKGLSDVFATSVLKAAIGMMAAGYFAMFFYDTLIAPLTRELGFTQSHLGYALAAVGSGGVFGALALSLLRTEAKPFVFIATGTFVSALMVGGLGLAELNHWPVLLPIFIAMFGVLGVTSSMSVIPYRTLIQNHAPEGSIGQITALSEAVNMLALLTAPFIGAFVASVFSVGAAFVLGSTVMFGVCIRAIQMRHFQ